MTKFIRKYFGSNTSDENYSRKPRSEKDTAELAKNLNISAEKPKAETPYKYFASEDFIF